MYIPRSKRKSATVLRLSETHGANGNITDETYTEVYGTHTVDLQPLTTNDLIANEQLKFKVSHWVFPERKHVMPSTQIGDFYSIGQKLYRIMLRHDHVDEVYFQVLDEAAERSSEISTVLQNAYTVDGLGPGVYTYGSGALAAVGPFSARPMLLDTLMNDGSYFINNPTASGFEIVDRFLGVTPQVSIYVKGVLS